MTNKEAKEVIQDHLNHWKRLYQEKICTEEEGRKTIAALQLAVKAIENDYVKTALEHSDLDYGGHARVMLNGKEYSIKEMIRELEQNSEIGLQFRDSIYKLLIVYIAKFDIVDVEEATAETAKLLNEGYFKSSREELVDDSEADIYGLMQYDREFLNGEREGISASEMMAMGDALTEGFRKGLNGGADVRENRTSDLISREDAIKAFKTDIMGGMNYDRILRDLPSVTPDAVSREVIEDIKAEISEEYKESGSYDLDYATGLRRALGIIDKHISGKENHETCN